MTYKLRNVTVAVQQFLPNDIPTDLEAIQTT